MRYVECLFAFQRGDALGMECSVIVCSVQTNLSQQFKSWVLIRRNHHFGQRCYPFAHRYLQTGHRTRFDIETLGVIAYGGEDELGFLGHIDAQHVRAVFVRGRAYLRAAKTDVHIRYGFTRVLVDNLADDNRLDGMKE